MELKTAGELMIPLDKYPHIPYWFSIRHAIAELTHSQLVIDGVISLARAVLVFDDEYNLMGLVRRRDIMKGFEPENFFGDQAHYSQHLFEVKHDPDLLEISSERLHKSIEEKAEQSVSTIMAPIESTVDYNDHLFKIVYEMNHHQLSMLPVIKDDAVVGVIRTVEVTSQIAKNLGIKLNT